MSNFSKNLKELRILNSITQLDLAKHLCVAKGTISNWENDNRVPDADMLIKIARYFNTSVDNLISDDTEYLLIKMPINAPFSSSQISMLEKAVNNIINIINFKEE